MIVIDIETSGPDPRSNGIMSIAALEFENPSNVFQGECRIRDEATIHPKGAEVAGYTEEQFRDPEKQTESELIASLASWAKDIPVKTLAGHNVGHFDQRFLFEAFQRNNQPWIFLYRSIDLHTLAYADMVKKGVVPPVENEVSALSLDTVLQYLGLPTEPKPHIAINGARYEAEAISRLLFGKKLLPEFDAYEIK